MMHATTILAGLILLAIGVGCATKPHTVSPELVEAIKQRTFDLPKEYYNAKGGSEPQYTMVVRHVERSKESELTDFSTNGVKGEWFYANKRPPLDTNTIATLKALGPKNLFTVHFTVTETSATKATADLAVSYGKRGGYTRKWTFSKVNGEWQLMQEVRKMNWD